MTRPVGYYVHHHGAGHLDRALAIAAQAPGRFVLLGTGLAGRTGAIAAIDLADDRIAAAFDAGDDATMRPAALHYAPLDHDGIRSRSAAIAGWIAGAAPALMVVDVSVEVAMLARLCSVPVVPVRLAGRRDDRPHADAFAASTTLLAPFHRDLDDPAVPEAIRTRTLYAPGLLCTRPPQVMPGDEVLVVLGRGGGRSDGERWAAAARALPERRWRVIGPCTAPAALPDNLALDGWSDDPLGRIAAAGAVVGGAGDGVIGAVLAARRPFVCLPEPRPFDEQRAKARRLAACGAAVVRFGLPVATDWPALLAAAAAIDPAAMARLDDPDGARQAAERLIALADGAAPARLSA